MPAKFEAFLYAIIFTFWSVRLYYKLYDKKTRRYILSIGILIVFWMFIRLSKGVVGTPFLERFSWYLYYVPLIFIPALFYICSNSLSKSMSSKRKVIIYLISGILLTLVLTNDMHQIVFKFKYTLDLYDDYKHNIGYYLIAIWIFYLLGGGMIKLAITRLKTKKDLKAFLPLLVLLIGIVYTCLYVLDFKYIRDINMSVVNSVLICLGIELALYLDLIPNNSKYIKTFENSNLNMIITSLNGQTTYITKQFKDIPNKIKEDIKNKKVKDSYSSGNIIYKIKTNKDSYVILKNDLTELYKLEKEINKQNKQLLLLQEKIKLEEKTKRELYEINLRKEIVSKIEAKLKEKRTEAKAILQKNNITEQDLEKIKRIIIYSKKKSAIMISEINSETYNSDDIKLILDELIKSMASLNISGVTLVKSKINISANIMSNFYDIIYEVLELINNTAAMIYISKEEKNYVLKIRVGSSIDIKDKLNLDKSIKIKEIKEDTDTEIVFNIKGSDNL